MSQQLADWNGANTRIEIGDMVPRRQFLVILAVFPGTILQAAGSWRDRSDVRVGSIASVQPCLADIAALRICAKSDRNGIAPT